MEGLDRLWAGWRSEYITAVTDDPAPVAPDATGSMFERILALPGGDEGAGVVHRGTWCSTVLNAYPYTSGHVLVLPNRAVPDLGGLDPEEFADLWAEVRDAVAAVEGAFRPEGVNVGLNLGRAAGAGVPDHVHVHVLPRWSGDTNFMTAVAEARVLPEPLGATWAKLREAWPTPVR